MLLSHRQQVVGQVSHSALRTKHSDPDHVAPSGLSRRMFGVPLSHPCCLIIHGHLQGRTLSDGNLGGLSWGLSPWAWGSPGDGGSSAMRRPSGAALPPPTVELGVSDTGVLACPVNSYGLQVEKPSSAKTWGLSFLAVEA